MLKNGIFSEMEILVAFKGFLLVKNLEILIQIVPDCSIYYYYCVNKFCFLLDSSVPKPLAMKLRNFLNKFSLKGT